MRYVEMEMEMGGERGWNMLITKWLFALLFGGNALPSHVLQRGYLTLYPCPPACLCHNLGC